MSARSCLDRRGRPRSAGRCRPRSRIVSRRQWASGWPGRERPRHQPAPEQPGRGGGGPLGRPEVHEQEVRHRRPDDQPASRSASASRSRSASTRATFAAHPRRIGERRGHDGHADRRHGAGRPVRRDPGDRLGPRDREADPEPGERVGLAGGPDDDEVRVVDPQLEQATADELGVRLVEHDGRRGTPGRRGIGGDAVEQRLDRARRARAGRSGCSGCRARRGRRRRPRRASPSRSSAVAVVRRQAAARPTAVAPRCSVTTRYIA